MSMFPTQEEILEGWQAMYEVEHTDCERLKAEVADLKGEQKAAIKYIKRRDSEFTYWRDRAKEAEAKLKAVEEQAEQAMELLEGIWAYHEDDPEFCENLAKDIARLEAIITTEEK